MDNKPSNVSTILNGIIKENPVLVLVLGTCPTLAVTTQGVNGIGMGLSTMVVLIGANIMISALKNIIPDKVRIPCYIVVIAAFVTVVQLLLKAYVPALDKALGLYIPLIVVNCIILGRAEMFASKNSVVASACDGIGMGLGFTLALFLMGSIREIIGNASWMGINLPWAGHLDPMSIFLLAPGGFFVFGCLIALLNWLTNGKGVKKKDFSCEACPSASACGKIGEGGCEK